MCDEADWCQGWSFNKKHPKACRLYLGSGEAVHPVTQWCDATAERTEGLISCTSQLMAHASVTQQTYALAASDQSCTAFCAAKDMDCDLKACCRHVESFLMKLRSCLVFSVGPK